MRTKPFEPSGLYSINTFSSVIDSKGSLMFKAMENAFSNNRFGNFSQFSKDGYCIASNIEINGKQMLALVKGNGEIAWLFSKEDLERVIGMFCQETFLSNRKLWDRMECRHLKHAMLNHWDLRR